MTPPPALAGAVPGDGAASAATPSLLRRMACFVYEATLLFGLGLIPGVLGAWFAAQTGQRHPLQGEAALQVFAVLFYGVYFVWFWSTRGQTLAMQTWRIRLVNADGGPVSQARALSRYAACCAAWFLPSTLVAAALHLRPASSLMAAAAGIAAYALLCLAAPGRQFWHDIACGTRLIDVRGEARAARR